MLTHGQRSLWSLAGMAPESPAYVIAGAARALGKVDAAALRLSLEALVARHDALRTTFAADDIAEAGEPAARVDPAAVSTIARRTPPPGARSSSSSA